LFGALSGEDGAFELAYVPHGSFSGYGRKFTDLQRPFCSRFTTTTFEHLALAMTAFSACVESRPFNTQIQENMKDAEAGATGTPSCVIGKTGANGLDASDWSARSRLLGSRHRSRSSCRKAAPRASRSRPQKKADTKVPVPEGVD
jgi:hypothetical protein